jgi:Transposase domain (DUF772)
VQIALPPTGTTKLLDELSTFIPDQFINALFAIKTHPGTRHYFSPAQLWRTHLLALLTPAHSFNAIVRLLPEQRQWRRFAHLSHRYRTPDVRMLYEFRVRAGVVGLRAVNDRLVKRLLSHIPPLSKTVAIIDATDLQAWTADKKKTKREAIGPHSGPASEPVRSKPARPDSLSATRSTRCDYGYARINRPCC